MIKSKKNMTYRTWESLVRRTTNPTHRAYPRYSKLGIYLPWLDFDAFVRDVGERPGRAFSIDRIDNERGYFPGNVRWATKKEQQRNTRVNVIIEARGESRCVSEWAEITGLRVSTIRERLKRGWAGEEALAPVRKRHRHPRKRSHFCKHGHEFTPENTYTRPNGRRTCRECRRNVYPSAQ